MKLALLVSAFLLAAPFATSGANAAAGVYTISGTGSGSLNGTDFTDAAYTFTLTGDTANLSGNVLDPLSNAVVNISGIGSATLSIPTRLGVNGTNVTFFSRSGGSELDLLDFTNASSVDLSASFGPITGTGVFALNQFSNVGTDVGGLTFSSSSDVQFSGVVGAGAVPEPASWVLMLLGFGAVGMSMRLKGRQRTGLPQAA